MCGENQDMSVLSAAISHCSPLPGGGCRGRAHVHHGCPSTPAPSPGGTTAWRPWTSAETMILRNEVACGSSHGPPIMATSQTQGALSSWGSGGPQKSWKSPVAKCGEGQLPGAEAGTLRPHWGCSNPVPLIFPGWQLQPLSSVWFPEAKFLRSDVADLERPFWGSSQQHTHTCTHTPTHMPMYLHMYTCVHTNTHTHEHTRTHKHMHRHVRVCTHTYRCIPGEGRERQTGPRGPVAAGCPPSVTDCSAPSWTRRCRRCGRFNYVAGGLRGLSSSPALGGAEAPWFAARCGEWRGLGSVNDSSLHSPSSASELDRSLIIWN